MKFWQKTTSLIALLGLSLVGCAQEENQPGTIIVEWDIVIGCSVANVETVEAKLIDLSSNLAVMSYDSASAACSADEPIIFSHRYRPEHTNCMWKDSISMERGPI